MNKTQKLYTVSLAMEKHLTGNLDELQSSFKLLEEVRKELLMEETLPLKEGEFWVQIGRESTSFYSATISAASLKDVKNLMSKDGFDCPLDTKWDSDGSTCFDKFRYALIMAPDGTKFHWNNDDGWSTEHTE